MAVITVVSVVDTDELFHHYPGQVRHQPCRVYLDCRRGRLGASYDPEIGGGIPADEYHGHTQTWTVPCLRAEAANALLAEVAPLAARVADGYEALWDGSNQRAVFDEDAQAAIREIEALCDAADPSDAVRAWDACDWITASGCYSRDAVRTDHGISSETSDEELADIEARIEEEALRSGEVDVLTGTGAFLRRLRDEAPRTDRAG